MSVSNETAQVVRLIPKTATRSEGCVATLENMLKLARDGTLIGVAVAGVDLKGCTHTAFEGGENIGLLIGATERVKFRLLNYQAGD